MNKLILAVLFMFAYSGLLSVVTATVTDINVVTGEVTERDYTQQELDDIAEAIARELPQRQIREALAAKKEADIVSLGTRAEMQAEAAAANSIPALRNLVLKLAEIIYSNEKNTID